MTQTCHKNTTAKHKKQLSANSSKEIPFNHLGTHPKVKRFHTLTLFKRVKFQALFIKLNLKSYVAYCLLALKPLLLDV